MGWGGQVGEEKLIVVGKGLKWGSNSEKRENIGRAWSLARGRRQRRQWGFASWTPKTSMILLNKAAWKTAWQVLQVQ